MHLGCSIGLAVEGSCQSPSAGWCWVVFRRNHCRRSGHGLEGQDGRSMMGLPSGDEDGMEARPGRLCHTTARQTGLDTEEA
jgi:hypothetical protein